jgi:hypothetical protein
MSFRRGETHEYMSFPQERLTASLTVMLDLNCRLVMFLMGKRIFLEVQYYPKVMQGLLANYEVIHWCLVSQIILNNILLKADLLAG